MSPAERLPQEVLLQVFENLVDPSLVTTGFPDTQDLGDSNAGVIRFAEIKPICRKDLRNVCLVSRKFKLAATTLLYRCAHLATTESPGNLVLALAAHPDLQPLVKHISFNPHSQGKSDACYHFEFAFSHHAYNRMFDPLLRPPESNDLDQTWFADCREYLRGGLLRIMVRFMPNLESLVIPQRNLIDGPFTKDLVLPQLAKLRITLTLPSDALFWQPDVDYSDTLRTTAWLRPDVIGRQFPALQRLEVLTAAGRWEANLTTEYSDAQPPLKFVGSLTTSRIHDADMAEWDLMSLERPIFEAPKLHTLIFDGPSSGCIWTTNVPSLAGWNLNRFFSEKGRGLRTLSLDWKHQLIEREPPYRIAIQEVYFGPAERLTTLNTLTNLTYLTVSLQALFYCLAPPDFNEWVEMAEADPARWLLRLFPPSLKTLRVAEYLPLLFDAEDWLPEEERYDVDDMRLWAMRRHNNSVYRFLQMLQAFWVPRAEGRELWFRRHVDLDDFAAHYTDPMGRDMIAGLLDEGKYAGSIDSNLPFARVRSLSGELGDEQ